jgi:hypothetical protein
MMKIEKEYEVIELPTGKVGYVANYTKQVVSDYRDNPLIEALPPILSNKEAYREIRYYPDYYNGERMLSDEFRLHCVGRLTRFVEPVAKHLNIQDKISRCLRDGYLSRNPMTREHILNLQRGKLAILKKSEITDNQWKSKTTAKGFNIIGISGIGKTTAVERVLSLYPEVLVHSHYKEHNIVLYQLPYLKLECPSDGSLRALCVQFFEKVDNLLGTNYKKKYAEGRQSREVMKESMSQIAMIHCIGVLVIDEIQRLSLAGDGPKIMLNFFESLVNTIGIPVVLIGTPSAIGVLQTDFSQGRRGSGQGGVTWDRMEKGEEWQWIIESMWLYQWTKEETQLTPELIDVLYDESQGIVDIAVKLYMLSQIEVIGKKKEVITPAVIRKVGKRDLRLIQKFIKALRGGNPDVIAKFKDINSIDIREYIEDKKQTLAYNQEIKLYKEATDKKAQEQIEDVLLKVIKNLITISVPAKVAEKAAKEAVEVLGSDVKMEELMKKAGEIAFSGTGTIDSTTKKSGTTRRKKEGEITEDMKLLYLFTQAKDEKLEVRKKLQEHGYIKSPLNDIFL